MTAALLAALLTGSASAATPPGNYEALPPGEVDLRPDAVGPESLRDFTLGNDQPRPAPAPARPNAPVREPAPRPAPTQPTVTAPAPQRPQQPAAERNVPVAPTTAPTITAPDQPASNVPSEPALTADPAPMTDTSAIAAPPSVQLPGVPQEQGPPTWMWFMVGLLALLVGYAFLRTRRPAVESGPAETPVPLQRTPQAPEPKEKPPAEKAPATARAAAREPTPSAPVAPPPPPPSPRPEGTVGITQKPDLILDLTPLRAVLTEEEFSIDYAVTMANRGNGPALEIGVDTAMVMAGPQQEQKIAEFIAHPPEGGRPALQMLNSHGQAQLRGTIRMPIAQVTVIPLEGRQLLMPTIVLSPRHRQGRGQPARFVVGRTPKDGDKLAPLRADLGPRTWRDLSARKA